MKIFKTVQTGALFAKACYENIFSRYLPGSKDRICVRFELLLNHPPIQPNKTEVSSVFAEMHLSNDRV